MKQQKDVMTATTCHLTAALQLEQCTQVGHEQVTLLMSAQRYVVMASTFTIIPVMHSTTYTKTDVLHFAQSMLASCEVEEAQALVITASKSIKTESITVGTAEMTAILLFETAVTHMEGLYQAILATKVDQIDLIFDGQIEEMD